MDWLISFFIDLLVNLLLIEYWHLIQQPFLRGDDVLYAQYTADRSISFDYLV